MGTVKSLIKFTKEKKYMINVIGLGYIGLPTALMLASHGVEVVGTDYNKDLVATLNAGKTTFKEEGLDELFALLCVRRKINTVVNIVTLCKVNITTLLCCPTFLFQIIGISLFGENERICMFVDPMLALNKNFPK